MQGKSLFILNEDSKFRKGLKNLSEHPYFDSMIYHLIGINTFLLAFS